MDKTVKLWDITTGKALATLKVRSEVESVAFAPDGNTLATGSEDTWRDDDPTVKLWDVTTRKEAPPPSKGTEAMSGRSPSPRTVRPWPRGAGM